MKKNICLTMIVKNESVIITKLLNSVFSIIDYWVICDTGSTDGTQEIIKNYFKEKNIEGILHETEWRNFGYNRTIAFEKASQIKNIDYYLVLDADDKVIYNTNNKSLNLNDNKDCYYFNIHINDCQHKRLQLFSAKLKWKYVGVLHEYPESNKELLTYGLIENVYIDSNSEKSNRNSGDLKIKYLNDAELLLKGLVDEPNNKRYY